MHDYTCSCCNYNSKPEQNKPMANNIYNRIVLQILSIVFGTMFVAFKLTGIIDWSWWFVLLPFYWNLALVVGLLGLVAIMFVCGCIIDLVCYPFRKSSSK